jgi:hypothetical protein
LFWKDRLGDLLAVPMLAMALEAKPPHRERLLVTIVMGLNAN